MNYWILKTPIQNEAAYLSALPSAGPEDYRYSKGERLKDEHPQNEASIMCFDMDYPENIKLLNFVSNINDVLIGDAKVCEVLNKYALDNIELLPIWIMDHQKSIVSKEYCIINLIGSIDIIDMDKSDYTMGSINKTQIKMIDELIIKRDNIPEEAKIFRASNKLDEMFINDELKQAFESAGLTGWKAIPADGWDGLDF